MEQCDFIVGNWYKGLNNSALNWYICFNGFKDNRINASEYIDHNKNYTKVQEWSNFGTIQDYEWKLVDIEELTNYLPHDHPYRFNISSSNESDLNYIECLNKLLNEIENV